jgi:hypothetical protein
MVSPKILPLLALPLLVACVDETPPPVDPMPPTCGAEGLQGLVGQPASVLETMKFAGPVRIIHHDMAVTMDFNPDRLNILLDRDDVIERVNCG